MENVKTLVIGLLFCLLVLSYTKTTDYYSTLAEVITVDITEDTVVFRTYEGFTYTQKGRLNWKVGDFAGLTMCRKGSDFAMDDKLINSHFVTTDFDKLWKQKGR